MNKFQREGEFNERLEDHQESQRERGQGEGCFTVQTWTTSAREGGGRKAEKVTESLEAMSHALRKLSPSFNLWIDPGLCRFQTFSKNVSKTMPKGPRDAAQRIF